MVTISGTVTAQGRSAGVGGLTVTAQSGDELFGDVTATTATSGDYALDVYSTPTRAIFARATTDAGLPIAASVRGPFNAAATVDLDLQPRSLTISADPDAGWVRDGQEILAVGDEAVLNVNTLRDLLLADDVTILVGADVVVDAAITPVLSTDRTLTVNAGAGISLDASVAPTGEPLDLILRASGGGSRRPRGR